MNYGRKTVKTITSKQDVLTVDGNRVYPLVLNMETVDSIVSGVKFKQYDYGTSFINIQLSKDGSPINLTNMKVVATFKNSKGDIFLDGAKKPISAYGRAILIEEGVVKIEIPKEVLKQVGTIESEIMVFDRSGNRSTSPNFTFVIRESIINHEEFESPPTVAVCGLATCGETICGDSAISQNKKSKYIVKSSLSDEFIKRFGGR